MLKLKFRHALGILAIASATATAPMVSSAEVRISSGHVFVKSGSHGKSNFHHRSQFHGKRHDYFDERRASGNRQDSPTSAASPPNTNANAQPNASSINTHISD